MKPTNLRANVLPTTPGQTPSANQQVSENRVDSDNIVGNTFASFGNSIAARIGGRRSGIEGVLGRAYREDWAITSPYLRQLLDEGSQATSNTAIVDAARRQIQRAALGNDESVNTRQANRANVHLTPSQQLAMSTARSMGATLNNTANVNTARINQYDANINALNRLIASTNAMKKGAASSLDQIAGNEANRRMQNDAARAQAKQARNQNIGMAAGLVLTAIAI